MTTKLEHAKREIAAAEEALDQAISTLRESDRAQKEIIQPALEAAFQRLRHAREALGELESIVSAAP